jgi:hypothetical protein
MTVYYPRNYIPIAVKMIARAFCVRVERIDMHLICLGDEELCARERFNSITLVQVGQLSTSERLEG